ncbi:MT-A70-domain-containing protein [Sistotremastrum suecicum HHB10207 ss-3]|uniref:mRNA m(6)A methyltransferase n=1 Tax=Sistotremastrum suecicum HHB10207 ss-3 TaxID=1314776 RepID=A0A166DWM5_9AGAM|nr:MT-A70-domain-containing protein [Sistotremastrum suecicum HHB10207 ss-3]
MESSTDSFLSTVSSALHRLLQDPHKYKLHFPLTSRELFFKCISSSPVTPGSNASPIRLPDLPRFERALEQFSQTWELGEIVLNKSTDNSDVLILNISLGARKANGKKRKRDEEDDSGEDEDETSTDAATKKEDMPLGVFSPELQEVYALIQRGTAKKRLLAQQFASAHEQFEPICPMITKDDCARSRWNDDVNHPTPICEKVHFRTLIRPHTDPTLGHCSYLNTCYSEPSYALSPSIPPTPSRFPGNSQQPGRFPQPDGGRGPTSLPSGLGAGGRGKEKAPCRYLHFEVDWDGGDGGDQPRPLPPPVKKPVTLPMGLGPDGKNSKTYPPQWLNCDLRKFDYSVLGKFHVIMADPPWDIHMSLPYGTMTDDEMRAMPIPMLQDEGLLFLWVTGRALEVGRECMRVWGYTRVDEVVWVKTNQLQRVIRTGRTGHWLNHTKEHMLVGLKARTNDAGELIWPSWINRGIDADVIVSEVRETSRKPEEAYGLIERICPGGRKVEIFGRKHNTRPGWLTLGNQLGNDQIYEEDLAARIRAR